MTALPDPAVRIARRELLALGALGFVLAVTAIWWALALWPLPDTSPAWLARTRAVCFGSTRSGLPTPAGWLVLVGEPLGMLAALMIVWGTPIRDGLRGLARGWTGRIALAAAGIGLLTGGSAAGIRVSSAQRVAAGASASAEELSWRSLDRAAPDFELVDQSGDTVRLDRLRGRSVIVAFAYAHCQTVCPRQVHDLIRASHRGDGAIPGLVVITLDPWRDTPARLGEIAEQWELGPDAHILSGQVPVVERALDGWGVSRSRDEDTGEISHTSPIFVLDGGGRVRYEVRTDAETAVRLARGLT